MGIETIPILDTFSVDATPLASPWSATSISGSLDTIKALGGVCKRNGTGGANQYRGTYGPNARVRIKIAAVPGDTFEIGIWINLQDVGTATYDGYQCRVRTVAAGTDQLEIFRWDNASPISLGSFAQELAAGDEFAFERDGTTMRAHYKLAAGGWNEVLAVGGQTLYNIAGPVALDLSDDTGSADDFGADTAPAVVVENTLRQVVSNLRW